jgi:uncharacterized membrane protein (DUF2068 family)
VWAIGLQILLTLVTAALLWGYTSQLGQLLIKSNHKLKSTDKSKRPEATYIIGSSQLTKDLHDYRVSVTVHALIVCVLFAIAAYAIWRGLGLAKWLYIVAAAFFSLSGIVALGADGPQLTNALSFIVALAAIVAAVLLLLPQSALFFAAVKAIRVPPARAGAAGAAGAPRPTGLRGLFAPPPPRQPRPAPIKSSAGRTPASTRPVTRRAGAASIASDGTNGRAKPKARTTGEVEAELDTETTPPRGRGKSRRVSQ